MDVNEQKQAVLADLAKTSSKIGDHTRYLGFGIVALCFAIITTKYDTSSEVYSIPINLILIAAIAGIATIFFDYLHCLTGYLSSLKALKNDSNGYKFNKSWATYRLRNFFFILKQISAILGVLILIYGIVDIL